MKIRNLAVTVALGLAALLYGCAPGAGTVPAPSTPPAFRHPPPARYCHHHHNGRRCHDWNL